MLDRITKITVLLLLAALGASGLSWYGDITNGIRASFSLALGGIITLVNFWAMRTIITRMLAVDQKTGARGFFLYSLKILVLFGSVAAALIWAPINIYWFSGGLSVLFPAVLIAGIIDANNSDDKTPTEGEV